MIRFVLLLLGLRRRLIVGGFRAAAARGPLARFAAIVGVALPALIGLLLVVAAAGLALAGWSGGVALASDDAEARELTLLLLRLTTFTTTGLLFLLPAVRASRAGGTDERAGLTRLLLLPLERAHLHRAEVLASAMDPWLLVVLPGLFTLALGVGSRAGVAALVACLAASALLGLALVTLAGLLGLALQLLLRERRRAEGLLLAVMVGWTAIALAPVLLERVDERRGEAAEGATPAEARPRRSPGAAERFPLWLQVAPSEAHARAVALAARGEPARAVPGLAWLATFAALAWLGSRRAWERLVSSPPSSGGGRGPDPRRARVRSLPFVHPATSAVALATARTFLRTVRGKLALVLTPLTVAIVGMVLLEGGEVAGALPLFGSRARLLVPLALGMSLLSLAPVTFNQFASDRAGLTLQLLAPIPERRLAWGKLIGGALIGAPCVALSLAGAAISAQSFDAFVLLAALVGFGGAYLLVASLGCWLSILFPKDADLSVLTQAGNPHQLAQVLGLLGLAAALGLGGLLAAVGSVLLGPSWGPLAGALVHAALAGCASWPLIEAAARLLERRREAVLLVAQGH